MMRISTLFFCLLLAAAAVGRYKAEAGVRADREAIKDIQYEIEAEEEKITELKLQVEVLESGPRLSQLAQHRLGLVPAQSGQLASAQEFAMALNTDYRVPVTPRRNSNGDFIGNAIAMADFGQPEDER